jgi:hypothetical protein
MSRYISMVTRYGSERGENYGSMGAVDFGTRGEDGTRGGDTSCDATAKISGRVLTLSGCARKTGKRTQFRRSHKKKTLKRGRWVGEKSKSAANKYKSAPNGVSPVSAHGRVLVTITIRLWKQRYQTYTTIGRCHVPSPLRRGGKSRDDRGLRAAWPFRQVSPSPPSPSE